VASDVSLRLVGQLGGGATTAAVDGERVLVGAGSRVVELDVAEPVRPREVRSSAALPASVSTLAMGGDIVVAGVGEAGIVVLDARDLAVIGSQVLPGYAEDLAIVGSLAFVADGPGGLAIVDLNVPSEPRTIGRALDLHRITGVAVEGAHAFLAAADEGLIVLDVRDPSSPRSIAGLITGGYAFDVALDNEYAYLADGWGGLRIVDVGDAASPTLTATMPTTAWTMGVSVEGERTLLAAGSEGLRIVDISDPAHPADLGALSSSVGHATGVVAQENLAVVSDTGSGIRLVAIADPGKVTELATYTPIGTAQDIALVGDRAFIAAKGQGLRVVDVSDPRRPSEVQAIATRDLTSGVAVVGSNVFFVTAPGLGSAAKHSIFGADASSSGGLTPGEPAAITGHVGQRTFAVEDAVGLGLGPVIGGPALQFAASSSTLLVNIGAGVLLVDGAAPTPCEAGFLQTSPDGLSSVTTSVAVAGELAYLEVAGSGMYVVDVGDPRDVRVVGRVDELPFNDEGGGSMLLAAGSTLYRASGGGLSIYDLAEPQRPRLRGTLAEVGTEGHGRPAAAVAHSLAYGGGHLFVADGARGLVVVDVSDPDAPRVAGRLRLPGDPVAVVVEGSRAYVASDAAGLLVVEWTDSGPIARIGLDATQENYDRSPPDREPRYATLRSRSEGHGEVAAAPQPCLVSVAADAGPGTLRHCLERAASGETIRFDAGAFPSDRPATIGVESALPPVAVEGLTIDAIGAGVILDGGASVDVGLHIEGTRARISGMQVTGFSQAGILVEGNDNMVSRVVVSGNETVGIQVWGERNSIVRSVIGADPTGVRLAGRQLIGVSVNGHRNVVGGPNAGDRNIISGNRFELIIMEASANTIEGNFIRVDRTGASELRAPDADTVALSVAFSPGNRIVRNVIAGFIVVDDPGSWYNQFLGNHIGVDASGRRTIPCDPCGLNINLPYNRVGGTAPDEGNLINGEVAPGSSSIFLGNGIGVDVDGGPLKGGSARVYLAKAGERNVIGGRAPGAANDIVGPEAILIEGSRANLVLGNRISSRGCCVGVALRNAGRNFVVANTISNSDTGIRLDDGAHSNRITANVLRGNALGVEAADSTDNLVSGNAFIDNDRAARDIGVANQWDDGRRGNYWSDFRGSDADGDGIIDRPREIPRAGIDRYPLADAPLVSSPPAPL
jgi:parallel beta-helix repeat protein